MNHFIYVAKPVHNWTTTNVDTFHVHNDIRLKKFKEAISDFDTYIKMNPNSSTAHSNRGIANGGLNNFEEAIKDYSKAIEINPNSSDSYFGRAGIKHKTGDKEGECSDLKKAADLGFERAKNLYEKFCK